PDGGTVLVGPAADGDERDVAALGAAAQRGDADEIGVRLLPGGQLGRELGVVEVFVAEHGKVVRKGTAILAQRQSVTMKINTEHLKRYKEILQLVWKYGRSDLVQQMAIDQDLGNGETVQPGSGQVHPEQLADDLEAMGPTFVKLGQVLSSRADLLPEPYLKALARLQDSVKPFSYAEVEQIVESELGVRISKAFSRF